MEMIRNKLQAARAAVERSGQLGRCVTSLAHAKQTRLPGAIVGIGTIARCAGGVGLET